MLFHIGNKALHAAAHDADDSFVEEAYEKARKILTDNLGDLHKIAQALLEYETLSGDEIINALKGVPPVRDEADTKRPSTPTAAVPISPQPSAEPA